MKIILLLSVLFTYSLLAQNNYSTKSNWLLETKTDEQKFKKIRVVDLKYRSQPIQ